MADEFDEHGQCVVCSEDIDATGKSFPCCGATYCPACARETVENECCAECFKEIDAQGDVDGYLAALRGDRMKGFESFLPTGRPSSGRLIGCASRW